MRVIVLDERPTEREAAIRVIEKVAPSVRGARDAKELHAQLKEMRAEVIVLGFLDLAPIETVRTICTTYSTAYVIALVDIGAEIPALLEAGVHEIVRRPVVAEELAARVLTPKRLRHLAAVSVFDLRALGGWPSIGRRIGDALAGTAGVMMRVERPFDGSLEGVVRAASIVLSAPALASEATVSIVVDERAMRWIGKNLLGDERASATDVDDALRELTNVAGSVVKTTAADDDIELTTGLPKSIAASELQADRCHGWVFSGPFFFAVLASSRTRENQKLPAAGLVEGMVVVKDLRTSSGALLVPAGTRITDAAAERIRRLLGDKFVIEVADAA